MKFSQNVLAGRSWVFDAFGFVRENGRKTANLSSRATFWHRTKGLRQDALDRECRENVEKSGIFSTTPGFWLKPTVLCTREQRMGREPVGIFNDFLTRRLKNALKSLTLNRFQKKVCS